MDTYTTAASWQLALNAAGGAVAAAEAVWKGEADCALALTRPPGHHATPGRGMGFCLLNNIAIAARVCCTRSVRFSACQTAGDCRPGSASRQRHPGCISPAAGCVLPFNTPITALPGIRLRG
jgi:hypothetical protein